MIHIQDKFKCSGCSACSLICPKHCIRMIADEEGFLYPQIVHKECVECHLCEKICPILSSIIPSKDTKPFVYAAKNTEEEIRKKSSSGGIFTALAEYIIEQNGIVFGAAFNEAFEVEHIGIEKKEKLERLRGSKYVQSKIGNTYQMAKDALIEGRFVLFTGTPCQIGGLKAFLQKDYKNLYTQDLICHGAPSPMVWERYLGYLKNKYGSNIKQIAFRNKEKSWKRYAVSVCLENGREIFEPFPENIYMQAFLKNLCLRPSCHDCRFKGVNRVSDITLADFWGIENVLPQMDDDKGISLILIHSNKGRELLNSVLAKLQMQETDVELAISENTSAIKSSPLPKKRKKFLIKLKKIRFDKLVKSCIVVKLSVRMKSKLKRLLRWNKK